MNREELTQRIADGASYLQQELTPQAREVPEAKMAKYREQLREMDMAERIQEPAPPRETPERVQFCIEAIREMLKDTKPRNRAL